jgi:hypothetical protein
MGLSGSQASLPVADEGRHQQLYGDASTCTPASFFVPSFLILRRGHFLVVRPLVSASVFSGVLHHWKGSRRLLEGLSGALEKRLSIYTDVSDINE